MYTYIYIYKEMTSPDSTQPVTNTVIYIYMSFLYMCIYIYIYIYKEITSPDSAQPVTNTVLCIYIYK